jgi:acyl-CoA thioester hydrolase
MIDLVLFRFSYPVQIRFADLDALEHINNAKYFTYMETARLQYFRQVMGWAGERSKLGVILARATCDFKLRLTLDDAIKVYARTSRIGKKSFDFEFAIVRDLDGAIAAEGISVHVAYDYKRSVSVEVPDSWRAIMTAYEPALGKDA